MQSNMAVGRLNKHVKRLEECSTSKKMSKKPLKKIFLFMQFFVAMICFRIYYSLLFTT